MVTIAIPEYIASLLKPTTRQTGRKVWSIDLETVWLPFFTATNTVGATVIPPEALGCPLRLAYGKDRLPKFNETTGKPVIRVAKELGDSVKMVRDNFVANLQSYAVNVRKSNLDGYKAEILANAEAGKPIAEADRMAVDKAIAEAVAEAMAGKSASPIEAEAKAEAELVAA
ncbi:MAG TPA: hypothetical protein VMW64_00885 [Dehalococcoidia bacterium]|nr:hypothetical protein [Dehalococcoidia bacterium]